MIFNVFFFLSLTFSEIVGAIVLVGVCELEARMCPLILLNSSECETERQDVTWV